MREFRRDRGIYKQKFSLYRDIQRNKAVYVMALPMILFYLVFRYLPMPGLVIAFQEYNIFRGFSASKWIGLENFIRFLGGNYAGRLIYNTFIINVYSILFGFPAPIILALMINEMRSKGAKKVVQTISYMPHFISMVVVCGIIIDFCRTDGIFNMMFQLFGITPVNLLTKPELFKGIYVGSSIWQSMGWSSIIYLATLSTVDPNLYDAAKIDGAGRISQIIHISLPALAPVIIVQFIMRVGHMLNVGFEKIILLYNPMTYKTADVISSYIYRAGLQEANYGFGTAVGIFNSIINIIILCTVNGCFKRFAKQSLW